MQDAQVTIVVVPRERLSFMDRCINSVFQNTTVPFKLLYVSGGIPNQAKEYLERESSLRDFRFLIDENYLSPNRARNLALPYVDTKYVVFLDNDTLVTKGWIEGLLNCAEETNASVVGPLYLIGEFERAIIHMAGGRLHNREEESKRILLDEQYLFDTPIPQVTVRLRRQRCDYVEFHCMLVRTAIFDQVGLMDEKLPCLHEERDFCLSTSAAGGSIYIEPKSVVTYVPPPPCEWWDLPYFMLRWSDAWINSSVRHFNQKWGVASVRHISDASKTFTEGTVVGFGRAWRRRIAGTTVTADNLSQYGAQPLDQARIMIALFQSVDIQQFDFARIAEDGCAVATGFSMSPEEIHIKLPQLLRDADANQLPIGIRPVNRHGHDDVTLIVIDRLTAENMRRIRRYAFLTLEIEPEVYQCWVALDTKSCRADAHFGGMLAQMSRGSVSDRFFPLAGTRVELYRLQSSTICNSRVRLVEGTVGLLNTAMQLQSDIELLFPQCSTT